MSSPSLYKFFHGKIMPSIVVRDLQLSSFLSKLKRVVSNSCDIYCIFYRFLIMIWKWRWKCSLQDWFRRLYKKNSTDNLSPHPERVRDWEQKCAERHPRLTSRSIQSHGQKGWDRWKWPEGDHELQSDKINTHWLKISKIVPFLKKPTAEHITLKEFFSLTQRSGRIPNIIHGGKSSWEGEQLNLRVLCSTSLPSVAVRAGLTRSRNLLLWGNYGT